MNIAKRLILNTGIQLVGKTLSLVLSLLSITLLTRYLGTDGYGNYSLVFSYLAFFGLISDMGLGLLIVKDYSKEKTSINTSFIHYLFIKIVLVIAATIISLTLLSTLPYSKDLKIGIVIGSIAMGFGSLNGFGCSFFQAKLRMDLVAIVDNLSKIVTLLLIFIFIYIKLNFFYIVSTVLVGNIFGLALTIAILRRLIHVNFDLNPSRIRLMLLNRRILIESLLMGILSLLAFFYFKIDVLILSIYHPSTDLGVYSLSYKIIENLLMIWGFFTASIYPLFSRYSNNSEKRRKILINSAFVSLIISVIFISIITLFAPQIIQFLGGNEFVDSIIPLRILILSIPFFYLNNLLYYYYLSTNRIKHAIISLIVALFINILFNLSLIPKYSYIAASYSTLVTEICLFVMYVLFGILIRKNYEKIIK